MCDYVKQLNKEYVLSPYAIPYDNDNPYQMNYEKAKEELYEDFKRAVDAGDGIFTAQDYNDYEIFIHTGEHETHDFYDTQNVETWLKLSYGWDDPLNQFKWEKRKSFSWADQVWCIILPPPTKLKDAKPYKEYLLDLYMERLQKITIEEKRLVYLLDKLNESSEETIIKNSQDFQLL